MSKALDAAGAAVTQLFGHKGICPGCAEIARCALAAALPEEPPEWFEEWMLSYGYSDGPIFRVEAWHALRAQLLGEAG